MNDEIKAAQQAITDAETDLERLRQRVVEGDTTIAATQLAERRGAIEWARLQLQAAERRVVVAAEKDREAQADEFRAQVDALLKEGDVRITETFIAAVRAVNAALDAVRDQRAAAHHLEREHSRVGALFQAAARTDADLLPEVRKAHDGTVTFNVRGVTTDGYGGVYVRDETTRAGMKAEQPYTVAQGIVSAALTADEASGHEIASSLGAAVQSMPSLVERLDAAAENRGWEASMLLADPSRRRLPTAVRAVVLAEDPDGPADEQQ